MDCKDLGLWLGIAQGLGLPALAVVAAALKGKDFMEGIAAIISAFRGTWTKP
jgi:hypothetical protein